METEFGFDHRLLKVLKGGIKAWEQMGFAVEVGVEVGAVVRSKAKSIILWGRVKSTGGM